MTSGTLVFDHTVHASRIKRLGTFMLVLGMHLALAAWAWQSRTGTLPEPPQICMSVRTIALPASQPAMQKPIAPQAPMRPVQPEVRPVAHHAYTAAPAMQAAPAIAEPATASMAAPAQQPAPAREEAAHAPAPPAPIAAPAVTAARFDADYLQNPAPVFPLLSRKLHEEGKVLLLVQVSAKGEADDVQIKQGSGYPRLDEAALNAVRKWRFVPARRGTEPVASSVVVPLVFRLDN